MRLPPVQKLILGVLLWLGLLAGSAQANTYCVQDPTCVGTSKTFLQNALDAAQTASGPDRVEIGDTPGGFIPGGTYSSSDPLEIVGTGQQQTRLGGSGTVLSLGSSGSVSVSDLTIVVQSGTGGVGLRLDGAKANSVEVITDVAANGATGAELLNGAAFQNGRISLGGSGTGLRASQGADNNVDEALVRLGSAPATGLLAQSSSGQSITFNLEHATVVGGGSGQYGASVVADTANQVAVLVLKSSIIDGVDHSLRRAASGGGTALLTTSYSNYPLPLVEDDAGAGGRSGTADTKSNPSFVNAAAGDFHLSASSPLIDAGEPGPLAAGEPTTDMDGNPRRLDGNGDCDARRDIGAFEFLPTVAAARISAAGAAHTGQVVSFDGSGSCDPDPSATLTYTWSFDDGGSAGGPIVQHSFATPGTHSVSLSVASTTGRSGTATRAIAVTVPTAAQSVPPPPPPPGPFSRKRPRSFVLISGRPVVVSERGVALIALRCKGVRRCTGVLSLATARPVDASVRKRVVKLGSTRFSIRGARTTRVRVRLSKSGLALIRKLRQVRVNATVTDRDSAGRKRSATRAIVLKAAPRRTGSGPARHEIAK